LQEVRGAARTGGDHVKRLLALCLLALSSAALAQPMMMDPSKMSGIPRPDPQVPAGTITVRLIRGQLSNRMTGVPVTLASADGKKKEQKTDGEGRATFAGLDAGPYVASAREGDTEMKSQPIALDVQMGSRVMLVFPASGTGAPDGAAHLDKTLPAGTVVVRAEDASGQAADGLEVVLAHARQGEQKVEERKSKTDVAGETKFEGLDSKPTSGYIVQVTSQGAQFASKPFRMEENHGMRVVITVRQVSADTSALSLAEGTHFLLEVTDETVQVIEVLRLHNQGTTAVDVGGDGLHIPLPRNALQAQATDSQKLMISGHDAVFHGPVPPGDTPLRVGFVLAHHGGRAELVQPTPLPIARVALVTQQLEGLNITGNDVVGEDREMQGRHLTVYLGGPTHRDGELKLSFSGLPEADPTARYVTAAIVVLIVLVFAIYAVGGGGAERGRLESERRRLFDELQQIDQAIARGEAGDHALKRDKHVRRLAQIYRSLDELGGG
jgi:hypothetical protein